jgi:hypothetical protein
MHLRGGRPESGVGVGALTSRVRCRHSSHFGLDAFAMEDLKSRGGCDAGPSRSRTSSAPSIDAPPSSPVSPPPGSGFGLRPRYAAAGTDVESGPPIPAPAPAHILGQPIIPYERRASGEGDVHAHAHGTLGSSDPSRPSTDPDPWGMEIREEARSAAHRT